MIYSNRQFHPGLRVAASRRLGFAPTTFRRNAQSIGVEESLWFGQISTTWPLLTTIHSRLTLGTSYDVTAFRRLSTLTFAPDDFGVVFPEDGRLTSLRSSLTFSNTRSNLNSISTEEGGRVSVGIRFEDPYLGSDRSALTGTISHTQFIENPWIDRHVLAWRFFSGYGKTSSANRSLFSAGGLPRRDLVIDFINERLGFDALLRGFPVRPLVGNAIASATLEYRFPILDIESGLYTLPLFIRTLHAATFVDSAALADKPKDLTDNVFASAGFELRLGLVLGYFRGANVRVGYAHAIGEDAQNVYLVLGQSF
ncbi:MAG: BamA/TamA family outer membrane protein [Myxococcota bacterium]